MTGQDDVARDLVQRAHAEEVRPAFDVEAGVSDVLARAEVEVLQLTAPESATSQLVASSAHPSPLPLGERSAVERHSSGRRGGPANPADELLLSDVRMPPAVHRTCEGTSVVEREGGGPVADFCTGLRRLQRGCGLDRSSLARRLGYSRSQLYEILDGRISRPPEWDRLVEPLVRVCTGNDEGAVAEWRQRHDVLAEVYSALRNQHRQHGTPSSTGVARVVPAQLPTDVDVFTGRANELAELDHHLAVMSGTSTAVMISVVSGSAGVGKTALAVRWAHRVQDRFPGGQLYVNLRGYDPGPPMTPEQALDGFLRALDVSIEKIPAGMEAKAGLYRSLLNGRRVLVVLDNAHTAEQVRPLLPGSPGCLVVVTSRNRLSGLIARDGAHRVNLDPLPPSEAVMLLSLDPPANIK
jgi:hypothetical protein